MPAPKKVAVVVVLVVPEGKERPRSDEISEAFNNAFKRTANEDIGGWNICGCDAFIDDISDNIKEAGA